jgi:hypothetical protein
MGSMLTKAYVALAPFDPSDVSPGSNRRRPHFKGECTAQAANR